MPAFVANDNMLNDLFQTSVTNFWNGGPLGEMIALWRISSTLPELNRIIGEINSKTYSGRVLAERLERLNRSIDVPSILVEVLRI